MAGRMLLDFFLLCFFAPTIHPYNPTNTCSENNNYLKIEHRWTSHVAIFQNLEVGCFQREVSSGLALESPQDSNLEVGRSYDVCSIFHVFDRTERVKLRKTLFENLISSRVGPASFAGKLGRTSRFKS